MYDREVLAHQIVAARRSLAALDHLDGLAPPPPTIEEAYGVQQAAVRLWDDDVVGWKVGATSYEIQRLFNIAECVYGPVFRKSVFISPARLRADDFNHTMLESEFAFRFNRDLPPRSTPYTRQDVLDAVDELFPAFEIVSPRFTRLMIDDIPRLVADFCANGGVVLGRPCTTWKGRNLSAHPVSLSFDGELRQVGSGASVIGDPVNALEWLVNTLNTHGIATERGQFAVTGTTTGLHAPLKEQIAVADFADFGTVQVRFG